MRPRPSDPGMVDRMQVLGKPIPAYVDRTERTQDFDLRYKLAAESYKKLAGAQTEREGKSPVKMIEAMEDSRGGKTFDE